MICVSLSAGKWESLPDALHDVEMAEIRLDGFQPDASRLREVFSSPHRLIATCRPGSLDEGERTALLIAAIAAGASLVDIELEASAPCREAVIAKARDFRCQVIVSYHNHERTPAWEELRNVRTACFASGADIAKIACRVLSPSDCARILSLYADPEVSFEGRLVAIGMGEMGVLTRVAATLLGAPFTYASFAPGMETAEGQLDRETLARIHALMKHG
jgi:3-dehydroquinate dehydratase I